MGSVRGEMGAAAAEVASGGAVGVGFGGEAKGADQEFGRTITCSTASEGGIYEVD